MSPNARSHTLDKPEPKRRGTSWFNRRSVSTPPADTSESGGEGDPMSLKRLRSSVSSISKRGLSLFLLGSKSKKEKAEELSMTPDSATVDENSTQPAEEPLEPPRPSIAIRNAFAPENRPLSVIIGSPVDPLNFRDQREFLTTPGPPTTDVGSEQATDSGPPPRLGSGRSLESSGGQTRPSNAGLDQTTRDVISSLQVGLGDTYTERLGK